MFTFSKTPKAIKARIRSYERALKKEKQQYGFIDDGYGKRYLVGPLYLLLDDFDGALQFFNWFEQEFPDDIGDPFQYLSWSLLLYKTGQEQEAKRKLLHTLLSNLYLIPHLLGEKIERLDIWHGSNITEPEYLEYFPEEYASLWDKDALQWLSSIYHSEQVQKILEEYIDIYRKLKDEPVGSRRTRLVERASALDNIELE